MFNYVQYPYCAWKLNLSRYLKRWTPNWLVVLQNLIKWTWWDNALNIIMSITLIVTPTNQTVAPAVCGHIDLCLEYHHYWVRQCPAGRCSRVDRVAVLHRLNHRTRTTYCTSPLRYPHTETSYHHHRHHQYLHTQCSAVAEKPRDVTCPVAY